MWRKGVRRYRIQEKWNYGLAFELGDLFKISSRYPVIAERAVVVYQLSKDLLNQTVTALAYDLNYAFDGFAFCDVGDQLDSGKVIW